MDRHCQPQKTDPCALRTDARFLFVPRFFGRPSQLTPHDEYFDRQKVAMILTVSVSFEENLGDRKHASRNNARGKFWLGRAL